MMNAKNLRGLGLKTLAKILSISKNKEEFEKLKSFFDGKIYDFQYTGKDCYFFEGDIDEIFEEAKEYHIFDVITSEEIYKLISPYANFQSLVVYFYLQDANEQTIKNAFMSIDEIRDDFYMSVVGYEIISSPNHNAYATIVITNHKEKAK